MLVLQVLLHSFQAVVLFLSPRAFVDRALVPSVEAGLLPPTGTRQRALAPPLDKNCCAFLYPLLDIVFVEVSIGAFGDIIDGLVAGLEPARDRKIRQLRYFVRRNGRDSLGADVLV